MTERTIIQSSGFANTARGVTLRLRQPNYRGLCLSLIEGIDIAINGQAFPADENTLTLHGKTYTNAQMAQATQVRWAVGECVDVGLTMADGLAPGVHEVSCTLRLRHPYFPPQFQPAFVRETRHITIVMPKRGQA